ncbi:MAG: sigma-70 family RNA polymerase sigma factor [Clostridia bacterium]|nr:sigma-70 family RNA polymerase sigma factor [Clostridia bacterium]
MAKLPEALFREHYKAIYRYLFSLTRDALLAEDLASETFLEMLTSLAGFRGQAHVRTWLFTIARRRWIAHLKKQKRSPETEALSLLLESPLPGPEEQALSGELAAGVERFLQSQPPRTQSILRQRLAGLSFYEIGQACGISESSARVIFFRAKQTLKETLEKEGLLNE